MTLVCARVPALSRVMEGDKLNTCGSEGEALLSFAKRALLWLLWGFNQNLFFRQEHFHTLSILKIKRF